MQPDDSSLVRRSPFSIYDLLPTPTFLILGSVIGLGVATAASLFHRHSHRPCRNPVADSIVRSSLFCVLAVGGAAPGGAAEIVNFMGVKVDRAVIQAAVASNTLERMEEKEKRSLNLPKSIRKKDGLSAKAQLGGVAEPA